MSVTCWVEHRKLWVSAPFHYRLRCKSVAGGRWVPERKAWVYPASPHTAKALATLFDGELSRDEEFLSLVAEAEAAQGIKNRTDLSPIKGTKMEPWMHQLQAYHFIMANKGAMLAMDMGTGKSKVTIDAICAQQFLLNLIVCPKSVIDVWPKEFLKHGWDNVNYRIVPLKKGTVQEKAMLCAEVAAEADPDEVVVFVMNYETAWRSPMKEWLLARKWGYVILDESHRAKAPGGKASMFLSGLGDKARRRLCLTGTPMPHSPLDIYAQFRFLDKGVFGTSKKRFEDRYAIKGGYQGYQILDWKNQQEMNEKIHSIAYFADKNVLDLPEVLSMNRYCELEGQALTLYKKLEKDLIGGVEDGMVTAANALVKLLRLQQITGGHVTDDLERVVMFDKQPKADLLAEIVEGIGNDEALVVFARFRHDLDVIHQVGQKLARPTYELSGRRNQLAEWQEATDGGIIAVQIQAGGVGIDLTRARYCIYYSMGFSLGDYEQSLARVHRPGQTRPVTYIHLVTTGTVDEKVLSALQEKKDVVQSILHLMGGGEEDS